MLGLEPRNGGTDGGFQAMVMVFSHRFGERSSTRASREGMGTSRQLGEYRGSGNGVGDRSTAAISRKGVHCLELVTFHCKLSIDIDGSHS